MDMEVDMEVEAAAQVSVKKEEKDQASPANNSNNDNNSIPSLLASARQHINEGNPSLALQTVVIAMRLFGGENAVVWTLEKARQLYQNRIRENAAADELVALFAECAIDEASPNVSIEPVQNCPVTEASPTVPVEPVQNDNTSQVTASMNSEVNESSILAETGRMQIVVDAAADGSSFKCLRCGGLVSNSRREEHLAFWCGQI